MDKEPIDLKDVEKDNSTDLDWKRYHIFKDLLQYDNPTTPVEAARQIDELISTKKGVEGESEIDFVEGYLWYLWGLLIDIVKLVPYNHAGQGKLLSTLEALSQLPPTTMKIWGVRLFCCCYSQAMNPADKNH